MINHQSAILTARESAEVESGHIIGRHTLLERVQGQTVNDTRFKAMLAAVSRSCEPISRRKNS